ncbi:hypothetical protein [Gloeothece verrucosa]|uniref:PEP-CTERM sorting domain-containing protein n=1 Tax=Gloeothece verrucosa (strain PCC 7822) TaxID=497965 RepID=E0UN21_GLOV7|nr:hypothetical protein [Gloeothece verrucosa]ADN18351.1 hypothetical protein Cyan7822_6596 [Gloeothece verrucosa PCC 7822]
MKNNTYSKLALTATGVILTLTGFNAQPAEAATVSWNLNFFDETGAKIGSGTFSYNDAPYSGEIGNYPSGYPENVVIDPTDNLFLVEDLTINISGRTWDENDASWLFWNPPSTNSYPDVNSGSYFSANGRDINTRNTLNLTAFIAQ